MITLSNVNNFNRTLSFFGLSSDTKPTGIFVQDEVSRYSVTNGSVFVEIDTGDEYMFDDASDTWVKIDGGGGGVKREIVNTLPTTNIDPDTIYLIADSDGSGDNTYIEYMYVNDAWEALGSYVPDIWERGTGTNSAVLKGDNNTATGTSAIAIGQYASATNTASFAEGLATHATGAGAHSEGESSAASGYASHTEGFYTSATQTAAHAEGMNTQAKEQGAHAEGSQTTASAKFAHSEGLSTTASAMAAHAEGDTTQATQNGAHSEGGGTIASGVFSHAEGNTTTASGDQSHSEGEGTIAGRKNQHVFGEYNIAENGLGNTKGTYVELVGNGSSDSSRSNARTLDWNGNEWLAGNVSVEDVMLPLEDGSNTRTSLLDKLDAFDTDVTNLSEDITNLSTNITNVVAQQVEQMQIHEGQTVIDSTLTIQGAAADAKKTGDELTDLQSAINKNSQVVYKTDISSTDGLIPFHASNGDSITLKTKDGSNFIHNDQLRFYNESGNMIGYWSAMPLTANSRTFTYNKANAFYIGITLVTSGSADYTVVNNSNSYNLELPIANMQNGISELQTQIDNISDDLYEQTVLLSDTSLHPFIANIGTTITITTADGTTLPEGNPYLQCYDSEKTFITQILCSSAYGTARTVTISAGNVAYVKMYATPSKTIKAYIPDKNKLVPKVEEIANIVGQNAIVVDASGNGDYTSFTRAIYETVDSGIDVIVKPGTYNIVSEYVALFGQSAVDNMADSDSATFNGFQYGVRLRKRKITFESGAHLVCDWTGHTVDGTHRFSALGVDYNVEIIGLDLLSKATFYAIHDDYGISEPYTVKYENCRVEGQNLTNANCIGGGCKKYSRHIIKNCYFNNNLTNSATVRYHNTNAEGAEPEIYVSNCYFNNWFTPRWYGPQTSKMKVYVNNCEARSIHKMAESSSYNVDNVELYKWCNTETDPVV